jgi:hypothetical protein
MGVDQLGTHLKTKKEVDHINDSPFIAKPTKIDGKYSGLS